MIVLKYQPHEAPAENGTHSRGDGNEIRFGRRINLISERLIEHGRNLFRKEILTCN